MSERTIDADVSRLVDALTTERGLIVALTGAGISLASGIPTFRGTDPGAIWARDITELATLRYFSSDPVGSWRWYRKRFTGIESKWDFVIARNDARHDDRRSTFASCRFPFRAQW